MHIEKAIKKFFKDIPLVDLDEFIMYFVYDDTVNFDKIKPTLDKFLEVQGITKTYWKTIEFTRLKKSGEATYFYDKSGLDLIQDIKISFLSYYYLRSSSEYKIEINKLKEDYFLVVAKKLLVTAKLELATHTATEVLTRLNDNENYFYGEKEDLKIIKMLNQNLNEKFNGDK